jgi:DNA-binding CsgD family transcriptional regulator
VTRKPRGRLTGREAELLAMLAVGLAPKEIAGQLGISVWTVRAHLSNARKRTGARTTGELIARAKRRIRPDQPRTDLASTV